MYGISYYSVIQKVELSSVPVVVAVDDDDDDDDYHDQDLDNDSFLIFDRWKYFNPLTANVFCLIETSQLICIANQLTGFYMTGNIDH